MHQPTELVSGLVVPDAEFNAGDLIANRYLVERELGRGGMGVVYLVKDQQLRGKEIALKLISHELTSNPQGKDRFVQEVLAAQELQHRNIIRVFHLDEIGGQSFFTMEYVPGWSLREVIEERKAQGGTFSLEECEAVLIPVLEALEHAHSRTPAVIHRDIKPDNIVVSGDLSNPQVKVLDFGLAKMLSPSKMTTTAMTMGTAYYMAPEQVKGSKDIDQRADLFSVGVVLYEMLTGEVPSGRFELPAELDASLPPSIDDLVDKALKQHPGRRHESAGELAEALLAVVNGEAEEEKRKRQAEAEAKRQVELAEKRKTEAEAEEARRKAEEDEKERQELAAANYLAKWKEMRAESSEEEDRRKAAQMTQMKLATAERIQKAKEAKEVAKREAEEKAKPLIEDEEALRHAEENLAREEAERRAGEAEERKSRQEAGKGGPLVGAVVVIAAAVLIFFLVRGGQTLVSAPASRPAPIAAASARPTLGALRVSSTPSGASVYWEGSYRGTTPMTLSNIKPGLYKVKLAKVGYKPLVGDVRIDGGESSSFQRILERDTPSLTIRPVPADATVKILNIAPKYHDGIELAPGKYTIQVSKNGYKTATEVVSVGSVSVSRTIRLVEGNDVVAGWSSPQALREYQQAAGNWKAKTVTPATDMASLIRGASPGDVFVCKPGVYRIPGGAIVQKPITIIGQSPKDVVFELGNSFNIRAKGVTLSGVHFKGKNISKNCTVWVPVDGGVTMSNCKVTGATYAALEVNGGTATVVYSTLAWNRHSGMYVHSNGRADLEHVAITENGRSGLVAATGGYLHAVECAVKTNKQGGVFAYKNGKIAIESSDIRQNKLGGIEARENGSVTAKGCDISDNGQDGIEINDKGKGDFRNNRIRGNRMDAIEVKNAPAPVFVNNTVFGAIKGFSPK